MVVVCGHDVHRWEKLTDQDADDRNDNAAGHYIQLVVSQLVLKLADFDASFGIVHGGHDLSPSLANVIAGVRPHLPLTLFPPL
jgi:hypothetical protein